MNCRLKSNISVAFIFRCWKMDRFYVATSGSFSTKSDENKTHGYQQARLNSSYALTSSHFPYTCMCLDENYNNIDTMPNQCYGHFPHRHTSTHTHTHNMHRFIRTHSLHTNRTHIKKETERQRERAMKKVTNTPIQFGPIAQWTTFRNQNGATTFPNAYIALIQAQNCVPLYWGTENE